MTMGRVASTAVLLLTVLKICDGEKPPVDEPLLSKYHAAASDVGTEAVKESIDVYIDYSYGMGEGMRATAAINAKLKDYLGGRTVAYYRVGASDTPPAISDITSPEANFVDLNNFKEPGSKLKVAIDRATGSAQSTSIFITDFERVEDVNLRQSLPGAPAPHPIDASAWAQTNFRDWLLKGNQIDVYAMRFNKPDFWFDKRHATTYPNWIYTLVFTHGAIIKNDSLYAKSAVRFLNDQYHNASGDQRHFAYNPTAFKIERQNDPTLGAANKDLVVASYIYGRNEGWDYYEVSASDLTQLATNSAASDHRVLNGVKAAWTIPMLKNVELGLRTTDVTESINEFSDAQTAQPPEVKTDVETGKKDTVQKPASYTFKKGIDAPHVFTLVFNPTTHEVGIKTDSAFAGVPTTTIYRVDLIIKSAEAAQVGDADAVLKLNYANGYSISSLANSLSLAGRDVATSIAGRVLHTFYFKVDK